MLLCVAANVMMMYLGPAGHSGLFKVVLDHLQVAFLFLQGISASAASLATVLGVSEHMPATLHASACLLGPSSEYLAPISQGLVALLALALLPVMFGIEVLGRKLARIVVLVCCPTDRLRLALKDARQHDDSQCALCQRVCCGTGGCCTSSANTVPNEREDSTTTSQTDNEVAGVA